MIAGVAANSASIAVRIPLSAAPSFAVVLSRTHSVSEMKAFPTPAPRYNPHSATPSRAFVQSGLR
jgi:hypothetical protein